ncbi:MULTISPECIES: AAA family ATPase [Vibrio]|uniref:AAA family ATPase n=1 Tax=Vibrio TaxID=662 RepID=UPI001BD575B6|nr:MULTISPECIES: AAA family ATPase [Vibrio]MBS9993453.1 AAA family ATPase [Vibrio alginolyticus]MDW2024317.1 AAA family ATPase [Vibrio sp. 397]MDW2028594.1 AAA family ATPase [Vibrio sp. 399]MDW2214804.1 AAA family ATPase [Vibrio sp. 1982]
MNRQKVTLIRGIPGSGKTTMAIDMDATLVETDQFFVDKDGEYRHDRRFIKDAHAWCQMEMKRLLLAGNDVVVANTFIKKWEIVGYLKVVQSLGLELDIEVLEAKGEYPNVHGVPEDIVCRMKEQYEQFALKTPKCSQRSNVSLVQ